MWSCRREADSPQARRHHHARSLDCQGSARLHAQLAAQGVANMHAHADMVRACNSRPWTAGTDLHNHRHAARQHGLQQAVACRQGAQSRQGCPDAHQEQPTASTFGVHDQARRREKWPASACAAAGPLCAVSNLGRAHNLCTHPNRACRTGLKAGSQVRITGQGEISAPVWDHAQPHSTGRMHMAARHCTQMHGRCNSRAVMAGTQPSALQPSLGLTHKPPGRTWRCAAAPRSRERRPRRTVGVGQKCRGECLTTLLISAHAGLPSAGTLREAIRAKCGGWMAQALARYCRAAERGRWVGARDAVTPRCHAAPPAAVRRMTTSIVAPRHCYRRPSPHSHAPCQHSHPPITATSIRQHACSTPQSRCHSTPA